MLHLFKMLQLTGEPEARDYRWEGYHRFYGMKDVPWVSCPPSINRFSTWQHSSCEEQEKQILQPVQVLIFLARRVE